MTNVKKIGWSGVSTRGTITLRDRGVRRDIMRRKPITFYNHCENITIGGGEDSKQPERVISRLKQLKGYSKLLQKPLQKPFLLMISGMFHAHEAQLAALYLFMHAVQRQNKRTGSSSLQLPLWHTVWNGYHDRLRDAERRLHPSMLVIDGLYANSSQSKIENVRDLLYLYSGIPRIVVAAGADPVHIAYNVLHIKPTNVLYFGRSQVEF